MTQHVRPVAATDAAAIAAIYAPYVGDTAISFELGAPSADEIASRIRALTATHPWLVAQDDSTGALLGYAYASPFRARPAYRFTAETTVYVATDAQRRGVGRLLYRELLDELRRRGFRRAVGGITLPNAASVGLHEAMGFRRVGVFEKVGWKFGRWHDVGFWDAALVDGDSPPGRDAPGV